MRKTCAGCKNIIKAGMFGGFVIGCSKTGCIIPHSIDHQMGEVVFWRIPIDCPLPDSEVHKSKKQAAKKDLVIMKCSEV